MVSLAALPIIVPVLYIVVIPVCAPDAAGADPHDISVPSLNKTSPLLPRANAAGSPDESPYIILPLANPAILAKVTALSAISSVSAALSANIAFVIPAALTLMASEFISIELSSTPTARTPLDTAIPSPARNVPNLDISDLLIVPASLIINSSVAAIAAPISVRPETILLFNIEPSTVVAPIVKAPADNVKSPDTVVQDKSPFASATNNLPLAPASRAAGLPDASPYIIFPLANPAILSRVTALSAISSVSAALSANIAFVIPCALTLNASEFISIEESSTPTANTPLLTANPSPAKNVPNLETSVLLIVPASLIMISSVAAIAAPISVNPDTILLFNMEPSTDVAAIVNAPADKLASPDNVVHEGSPFASATSILPFAPAPSALGSPLASPTIILPRASPAILAKVI